MAEPVVELELYLVRHGQSTSNAGQTAPEDIRAFEDPFLTEKGARQAALLGEYYARVPFDCILASGQNRALQTAGEVAKRQQTCKAVEAHPLFTECGLTERFGKKSFAEIRAAHPFAVPALGLTEADNFVVTQNDPPDEERLRRAEQALCYLRGRFHSGERVMVVAHAQFNTFFMFAALGLGTAAAFDVAFFNACVTKFLFFKAGTGRWGADTHVLYHNDGSHLAGEFADELLQAY